MCGSHEHLGREGKKERGEDSKERCSKTGLLYKCVCRWHACHTGVCGSTHSSTEPSRRPSDTLLLCSSPRQEPRAIKATANSLLHPTRQIGCNKRKGIELNHGWACSKADSFFPRKIYLFDREIHVQRGKKERGWEIRIWFPTAACLSVLRESVPPSAAFPGTAAGSWTGSRAAGLEPVLLQDASLSHCSATQILWAAEGLTTTYLTHREQGNGMRGSNTRKFSVTS